MISLYRLKIHGLVLAHQMFFKKRRMLGPFGEKINWKADTQRHKDLEIPNKIYSITVLCELYVEVNRFGSGHFIRLACTCLSKKRGLPLWPSPRARDEENGIKRP